jgi:exonuclease III
VNLAADPQPAGEGGPIPFKYPNLSFCSQNLRSLNVSTKNNITKEKIYAITQEKTDVILICDLKLNSDVQKAEVHDVEKYFMLNGYKLYHNSTKSTRGVGILISRKLAHTTVNVHKDPDCNILFLEMEILNQRINIGLIYGPNNNDPNFFINLENFLRNPSNGPTILGGDFNTTWDDRQVNVNLDTHAMQNIPSIFRTNKLRELCTTYELIDPYRALYPNKKDYTFIPSAVDNLNRSRIDMFLINVRLLPYVKNCLISPGLLTAHFDHKCISLNFKSKIGIKNYPVKNCILKEEEVNWQVKSSVIETYIQHATIDVIYSDVQKNLHLLTLGRINSKIQDSLSLKLQLANVGTDNLLELQIAAIKPEVEDLFDSLPDLAFFENLPPPDYCHDGLFFDTLVHCVRNGALLQQKNIFNVRAHKKQELITRLKNLKQDYTRNSREIHATDRQLNGLISNKPRAEILQNKKI